MDQSCSFLHCETDRSLSRGLVLKQTTILLSECRLFLVFSKYQIQGQFLSFDRLFEEPVTHRKAPRAVLCSKQHNSCYRQQVVCRSCSVTDTVLWSTQAQQLLQTLSVGSTL